MVKRLFLISFACLLALFASSAWASTPTDITAASNAAQVVFNAYVRALRVLPSSWSCSVQKKLGLYVAQYDGSAAYAVFQANTCEASGSTDFFKTEYVFGTITNPLCTSEGYCDYTPWTRGRRDQYMTSCYQGKQFVSGGSVDESKTCDLSTIKPACLNGASGFNANNYNQSGNKYPNDYYFITLFYDIAANCNHSAVFSETSYWIKAPSLDVKNDTNDIYGAIAAAGAVSIPIPGGPTLNLSGNDAEWNTAASTVQNGIIVSTGVPDLGSEPPDEIIIDTGTGSGITIVSSNTFNVNFSTAEIVERLDTLNNKLSVLTDTMSVDDVNSIFSTVIDSNTIAGKFKEIIDIQVAEFQNTTYYRTLHDLIPPDGDPNWKPCFDLNWASTTWHGQQQIICLSDFPNWDTFILPMIQFVLFFLTALWSVEYMWRD